LIQTARLIVIPTKVSNRRPSPVTLVVKQVEKTVVKMSESNAADFEILVNSVKRIKGMDTAEDSAQAFIDIIYEYFQASLVLLRLFLSVPYAALPTQEKQLVDKKSNDSGTAHLYNDGTPVLTLLGTRGQKSEWNERHKSQGFRCIPLVSSAYVSSLSMLSMQFKKMGFDLRLLDAWDKTIVAIGHADEYSGMLYVHHAGIDKDEQGRMIVPHQAFVAENNIKSVVGFGGGYPNHPTIATLFAFTNEILSESMIKPFASLLEAYISISKGLVGSGRILS